MEYASSGDRFWLGTRVHNETLARKSFAAYAIGVEHLETHFVISVRLQINDAARKHVRTDDVEANILERALSLKPEQRHAHVKRGLADLAILDLYIRIAIVVPFYTPFETKARQCRWLNEKIQRLYFVVGGVRRRVCGTYPE